MKKITHIFLASVVTLFIICMFGILELTGAATANAAYHVSDYRAIPPIHVFKTTGKIPQGLTPTEIKNIYHIPQTGGSGTIALVGAYDDVQLEQDLADFSHQFNLPPCTVASGCLEKHAMASGEKPNSTWNLEETLDVEWAHAIAPTAHLLLVEAPTQSLQNLLAAVDYAATRRSVVAVSISWGGAEFAEETTLDSHFTSSSGAVFFASSGDRGTGASWPASSPNVIAVGGTSVSFAKSGSFLKETAWVGSGGGVSAFEAAPSWQKAYIIPKAAGMRAIPDVSYNADPASGYPIIHAGVWRTVGGTSAGAPQWAAIVALGKNNTINAATFASNLYSDKASANPASYFRDIVSGSNGDCGYFCMTRKRYDYVTGLGSPQTIHF